MQCYSGQKLSIQGVENISLSQFLVILNRNLSGFNRDFTYCSFKCEDRSNIRLFLYPATHLSRKINISHIADEEWYIENGTFNFIEYATYTLNSLYRMTYQPSAHGLIGSHSGMYLSMKWIGY